MSLRAESLVMSETENGLLGKVIIERWLHISFEAERQNWAISTSRFSLIDFFILTNVTTFYIQSIMPS